MTFFRALIPVFAITACQEHDSNIGKNHPDAQTSAGDDATLSDAANTTPPPACTGTTRFAMNGPAMSMHIESTSAPEFMTGGSNGQIVGAHGALTNGTFFSLRRDGDFSDGDLESLMTYDVSQYPYNILFSTAPTPHEGCEGTSGCKDWLAVAGMFKVTEIGPVYRATFTLSMLGEGDSPGGAPIAGSVTGCFAIPQP
jgi:hypothetical protein